MSKIISGGGQMGARVRAFDWSKTDLGTIEGWPQSLRTAVSLILSSQHPMWIGWGAERTFLYNDAYIEILGPSKHPWALGRPFSEVWAEIMDVCGPLADKVFEKGEATFVDNVRLFMRKPRKRDGTPFLQEEYYSFSYSPIQDESGNVGGLFCPSASVTEKILSERRLTSLSELSANALAEKTVETATNSAIRTLEQNVDDIPFALLYLVSSDREKASLQAASEVASRIPILRPAEILIRGNISKDAIWPLKVVVDDRKSVVVPIDHSEGLPRGLADQPVSEAILLPLISSGAGNVSGVLIAGINPARELDSDYRTFLDLVARHVSSALQSAQVAEEERKRIEALSEIDRAKTAFFSNVSHEFRTPLTLMLGPIEDSLADQKNPLPRVQRERQELAHRNALRLLKLVNSLLDFSRIEAGRTQAVFEATDLGKLTEDLAAVFRSAIEKAGLKLITQVQSVSEPVFVDRELWEKIVLNLLSNAFKFTFEGEIRVTFKRVDKSVELEVADTGTGIPESEIPKLFERFHRVEGARGRSHEGTGIGLALIQELVRMHGGTVSVKSKSGMGTAFTVSIPLGHEHLPKGLLGRRQTIGANPVRAQSYANEAMSWLPKGKVDTEKSEETVDSSFDSVLWSPVDPSTKDLGSVLLVDDNADMRHYVESLLTPHWQVQTAANGEEALEIAQSNPPCLILSDVMMPGMDGFQLLQAVRENPKTKSIPMILLSARAGEESTIEGLRAGADDYLVKPFSAKELLTRMDTQLRLLKSRLETERARTELYDFFMQAPAPMVVLLGPEHRFFLANPPYEEFVGKNDVTGKTVLEVFTREEVGSFIEILDDVYQTGKPFVGQELPLMLKNGSLVESTRYINLVYHPYRERDGEIKGILAVLQDVTEQVLARQNIERLAAELKDAVESRDEFLSIASHELKTPITALKMQLQMAKRQVKPSEGLMPPPEKLAKFLDVSTNQIDRMTGLIEDMLDVARVQAGRMMLHCEPTSLAAMLGDIVDRFADQLSAAGCDLIANVPEETVGNWDRTRLEQVLVNLVSNSIKYASGASISVTANSEADVTEIVFQDSGPGIPKECQASIFNRFERATSSRNISGLGLGLYISKEIVEAHGGTIRVESDLGKGTKFLICLPTNQTQSAGHRSGIYTQGPSETEHV